ncbi:MAG: DUF3488 and transglutaminase-like domain-containing protein, partial [Planctomycetota bacterium]|nr:DUF3488 and transglutaminase-like domain-containing protein [Planctomycetota bacterium]
HMEAAVFPAPFALQVQAALPATAARRRLAAGRYSQRSAAGIVLAMLALGAFLFLIAPRFAAVGWRQLLAPPAAERTEESSSRDLGLAAEMAMRGPFAINLSAEEVMRVRLSDRQGNDLPDMEDLRLRGWAYDVYYNGVWRRSGDFQELHDADDGNRDGWVSVAPAEAAKPNLIRQTIEPQVAQPAIFGIPRVCFVQAPALRRDSHGNLAPPANIAPLRYVVLSDPSAAESAAVMPLRLAAIYRALPPAFERFAAIARAITKPRDDARAACERFAAYLRDNFEYTLDAIGERGQDPLAAFLAQRRGCCMHFATAMAAMARAIGLPSRVVGGYYTTEKEGEGNLFIVRRMHAHAWAEVWFDRGWQTIDATPAGAIPSDEPQDASTTAPLFAAVEGWLRSVAMYGQEERHLLLSALWQQKLPLVLVACLLGAVWFWLRQRRFALPVSRKQSEERQPEVAFFNHYLRALEKLGIRRRAAETASELAHRASGPLPAADVQTITSLFEKIRYGGAALDAAEKIRLREALRSIETASASIR